MLKAVGGYIYVCVYCGENAVTKGKYCANCKTQAGRKKIFDENVEIIKENKEKGHTPIKALRDWH